MLQNKGRELQQEKNVKKIENPQITAAFECLILKNKKKQIQHKIEQMLNLSMKFIHGINSWLNCFYFYNLIEYFYIILPHESYI